MRVERCTKELETGPPTQLWYLEKDRSKQSPKEPEIRERTFIENIRTSVQYANREGGVKCEDMERKTKE